MKFPKQKFDEERVRALLYRCWSGKSSSLWTAQNPARGQCGVTALIVHDQFGGEILKTPVASKWHFYNQIEGKVYDLTRDQFQTLPEYLDVPASREEAFADTNRAQYFYLSSQFKRAITQENRSQSLSSLQSRWTT